MMTDTQTTNSTFTKEDETVITEFLDMIKNGVSLRTVFIEDPVTGNITHDIIEIEYGTVAALSEPRLLPFPLRIASAEECNQSVN